jgi:DNA-directed RNA polymerase specialized sigma subunit
MLPLSQLFKRDAELIRNVYSTGKLTQKDIGDVFGISHVTVSAIVRGKLWV